MSVPGTACAVPAVGGAGWTEAAGTNGAIRQKQQHRIPDGDVSQLLEHRPAALTSDPTRANGAWWRLSSDGVGGLLLCA